MVKCLHAVNLLLRANHCRIEAEQCDDRRLKVLLLRSAELFEALAQNYHRIEMVESYHLIGMAEKAGHLGRRQVIARDDARNKSDTPSAEPSLYGVNALLAGHYSDFRVPSSGSPFRAIGVQDQDT